VSAPVVGVDVGGTKVLAGVVSPDGRVTRRALAGTPGRRVPASLVEDALVAVVGEVADGLTPAAVGVAAAGFVDAGGERVMFAPHLPWAGEEVRSVLARRLGCAVVLENDATCAAVAEAEHGVARGARSAVVVTLGTGIGGAVLLEGRAWRGAHGMAGEFGHMQVVPDGRPCECGRVGCWEQYCSGHALVRYVQDRLAESTSPLAVTGRQDPGRITGPAVTAAAAAGDPLALAAFASVGSWLGLGLANLVAALDPDLLVVGGGVSDAGDLLLAPARARLAASLAGGDRTTREGAPVRAVPALLAAGLGPEAGLVGAAVLARRV
jgi:glucokinase